MLLRGARWWLALGTLLAAMVLVWLLVDTYDRLQGVMADDRGGRLLQDAVDDLQADARASPEAREPSWMLTGGAQGDSSRGLAGWVVVVVSTQALVWLTGYRFVRSVYGTRVWAALLVVAAATVVFWLWWLIRAFGRSSG